MVKKINNLFYLKLHYTGLNALYNGKCKDSYKSKEMNLGRNLEWIGN